jgi:hypothetical protein
MKRQLLTVLLLLALSSLALGQAILPMPNLVDHQTTTDNGSTTFTFTENIASAYNILYLVVTCDLTNYEAGQSGLGCGAALTPPVDSNTPANTFTPIEHHGNTSYDWSEEAYYAIIPQTGSDVITFTTVVDCSNCTWKAMIEQVQGIQADN